MAKHTEMMQNQAVESRRPRTRIARSTVSLRVDDYARLKDLATRSHPPVSVRFVIELAVVEFLRSVRKGKPLRIGLVHSRGDA